MLQAIATFIAALGVFLGILTLRAGLRQRHRQFEALYVTRYWDLMDRLSLEALKGTPRRAYSADDERAVRAYLRLCEDECELRAEGWIADNTWRIWRDGMRAQMRRWPFKEVWKQVQDESTDFRHLNEVVNNNREDVIEGKLRHLLWSRGV